MKYCIIIALVIFAPGAYAAEQDYRLGLILASSHHFQTGDVELNESNPGIFGSINGWTLAIFENSYNQQSKMFGHEWQLKRSKYGSMATSLGIADGYEDDPHFGGKYQVWAALSFRFGPAKYWYAGAVSVIGLEHQIK